MKPGRKLNKSGNGENDSREKRLNQNDRKSWMVKDCSCLRTGQLILEEASNLIYESAV